MGLLSTNLKQKSRKLKCWKKRRKKWPSGQLSKPNKDLGSKETWWTGGWAVSQSVTLRSEKRIQPSGFIRVPELGKEMSGLHSLWVFSSLHGKGHAKL